MDFDFTVTTTEGYVYEPYTDGHAVGFICTAPNGKRQAIQISPCGETDNGFASVFINLSEIYTDGTPDKHMDDGTAWQDLFDVDTTADTLARDDLKTMSMGDTATEQEIALRAAEYVDHISAGRRDLDVRHPADAAYSDGEEVHDLRRIVQWLRLYGVPSHVELGGGNVALVNVGDKVTIGPGWYADNGQIAKASTAECYVSTDDTDPGKPYSWQYTELEMVWIAISMLTGRAPWQIQADNRRSVVKAAPVGPPITETAR